MNAHSILLLLALQGQVEDPCLHESFPERILLPFDTAQKGATGIAMDRQGDLIALTQHTCGDIGPCPDKIRGWLFNCRNEPTREMFPLIGRETERGSAIAKAPNGDHFLVWGTGLGCLFGQALDREGQPVGEKRLLYPDTCPGPPWPDFYGPALAADNEGNYVAGWGAHEPSATSPVSFRFRKYDHTGNWLGHELLIRPDDYPAVIVARSEAVLRGIHASENGDVLVMTLHGNTGDGPGPILHSTLVVWRLNSELKRIAEPVIATTENRSSGGSPGMGVDAQGNFVVSWGFAGTEWIRAEGPVRDRIFAQRFTRAGERVGPEILVTGEPVSQFVEFDSSQVLMRADGAFLVLWGWKRRGVIMGQRFTAAGERIGRRFQVNVSGPAFLRGVTGDRKDLWAVEYPIGSNSAGPGPHTVATRILNFSAPDFIRGDANGVDPVDLSDAVFIVEYLFLAGPVPAVWQAADVNDDDAINVSDPIYLLTHLFLGGPAPPHPYPIPAFVATP